MNQPYFFIRQDRQFVKVAYSEILYIEARRNYVFIHAEKGRYMSLLSIKRLEKLLPDHLFCRVHRSFIVSLDKVTSFGHDYVRLGDIDVPLGERFRENLFGHVLVITSDVRQGTKYPGITVDELLFGQK